MSLHPYQYVTLRCVPRVDREEFLNVGIVLYSQSADFLVPKIVAHAKDRASFIELGNTDVARDFSDVRCVAGLFRPKPKMDLNPLSPLVPPRFIAFRLNINQVDRARAWVMIEKYTPRMRLRNVR